MRENQLNPYAAEGYESRIFRAHVHCNRACSWRCSGHCYVDPRLSGTCPPGRGMSLKELNRAEQESRLGKGRRTNAEGGIGAMAGAGRHRANSEITVFLVADNQLLREVMARLFQKRGRIRLVGASAT